ncbi:hypothetical protein CDAR_560451 [Caerostris darwini]|uniref:Uncharacterized protein n=1 Tax=Caerostris darwini TaxID=1538125 RepID=A0AAV4VZ89_9ARAC|nr:hypothetical protein CDAR_560191 [Caerostris darwini]GIY75687.1 hypothetical protein CDAR_560451 [Caerostris darwini]
MGKPCSSYFWEWCLQRMLKERTCVAKRGKKSAVILSVDLYFLQRLQWDVFVVVSFVKVASAIYRPLVSTHSRIIRGLVVSETDSQIG